MAKPEFIAQDDRACDGSRPVSTGFLKRIDQNVEYVRNERAPCVARMFNQLRPLGGGGIASSVPAAARLPVFWSGEWACYGPWAYKARPTLQRPTNDPSDRWIESSIDLLIGANVVDPGVDVVAFSAQALMFLHGNRSFRSSFFDAWLDANEPWTASLTAASTARQRLSKIRFVTGWNDIYIAIRSKRSARSGTTNGIGTNAPGYLQITSGAGTHGGNNVDDVPAYYASITDDGDIDNSVRYFTVAYAPEGSGGAAGSYQQLYCAETHDGRPLEGQPLDGTIHFGDLGTIEFYSLFVDPNSQGADGEGREWDGAGMLRWFRDAGQALYDLAARARAIHKHRLPQYAMGFDQHQRHTDLPKRWRIYELYTDAFTGASSLPKTTVAHSCFRHNLDLGGWNHEVEFLVYYTLIGEETTSVTFTLEWLDISGSVVGSAVTQTIEVAPETLRREDLPDGSHTSYWVKRAATVDATMSKWAMDGLTALTDVRRGFWRRAVLRLPVTDVLTLNTSYRARLSVEADATERKTWLCIPGWGVAAELDY